MMETLNYLLSPYTATDFLAHHWQTQALHIPAKTSDKFGHLFSWETLSYLLNFHEKKYPLFRLAYDKKVLKEADNEHFLKRCQEGATLIIDQIDKRVPEVAQLAQAIRYELGIGHRTQVNGYCSWPGKQGFDCHYDTHEVFILQIEGSKEWFVFPDTIKAPLPDQSSSEASPPDTPPYIHTTLNAGDVLYIPRGHWHYAIAKNEPSVHLTLGIHCHKGIDIFDWLKEQFKNQEIWRYNVPAGVNELDSKSLKHYLEQLTQALTDYLQTPNLHKEYADYLASLESPVVAYDFPYQVGFNLEEISLNTNFYRPHYQRVMFDFNHDKQQYRVRVGNKELKLAGVPSNFLKNLFSYQTFRGQDIQNWLSDFDWHSEIMPLLSYLVKERIILIKHHPSDILKQEMLSQEIVS